MFLILQLFDVVRKSSPDALQRIVPIEGDLTKAGLGIKEEDVQTIINGVSAVFHLAANVNFTLSLREALQLNVSCVRELVKLARKMKKLKVSREHNCYIF